MSGKKRSADGGTIARNRKAGFDYFVEERFEAGLVLEGWEVKSLRAGRAQLVDSYVLLKDGQAWLLGARIEPLPSASTHFVSSPDRTRKLLLNQRELGHGEMRDRRRERQETARQACHREGPRLGTPEAASLAPRLIGAREYARRCRTSVNFCRSSCQRLRRCHVRIPAQVLGAFWIRRRLQNPMCMPRRQLVSLIQSCKPIVANDDNYALAA